MNKSIKRKEDLTLSQIADLIENLVIITKKGFDRTVSKDEFNDFRDEMYEFKDEMYEFRDEMYGFKKSTEMTLFNISNKLETVDQRLDAIEKILGPLVQVQSVLQNEIRSLNLRVLKLENQLDAK